MNDTGITETIIHDLKIAPAMLNLMLIYIFFFLEK